jgi:hypothetical protein
LAISRALAGHVDPGQAFRATAVEIETLIPHAHMDVAVLLDEGRSHACYEAGFHTSWSTLAECPLPTDRSPVRAVFRGEVPYLLTGDALADERFHFEGALDEPIYTGRLRSRIIVPMRARGTTSARSTSAATSPTASPRSTSASLSNAPTSSRRTSSR